MDDLLEFLYELMPPWMATAIMIGLGGAAGGIGAAWRSHEEAQVAACTTNDGILTQIVSSNARVDCGSASLFSKVALGLEIVGFVTMVIFFLVMLYLSDRGKLQRPERRNQTGSSRPPSTSQRRTTPVTQSRAQRMCATDGCRRSGMLTSEGTCWACNTPTSLRTEPI